ncbi:MAG: uracil-DNA glycosylase, partial [Rubrivivax sp.]
MSRLTQPLTRLLEDEAGAALGDWLPLLQTWQRSAAGRALIEAVNAQVAAGAVVHPAEVFRA